MELLDSLVCLLYFPGWLLTDASHQLSRLLLEKCSIMLKQRRGSEDMDMLASRAYVVC